MVAPCIRSATVEKRRRRTLLFSGRRSERMKRGLPNKFCRVIPAQTLAGLFDIWIDRTLFSCRRVGEHWFGVALGIPQNTEYLRKTLPEGTLTFRNILEFIYSFPDDSKRSPSILSGSPPFSK